MRVGAGPIGGERVALGTGPGRYIAQALVGRRDRIVRCLAEGEPAFETVALVGYDKPIVRCARCKTLKRQHGVVRAP